MAQFRWKILKVIALSALFGFVSGILGGLIIANAYAPVYGLREETARPPVERGGPQRESDKIEKAESALVTFYALRGRPLPAYEDRLGYGTMLTSDGWAVSTSKVIRLGASKIGAITGDRAVHEVELIVADKATDAVFVKIKGDRFTALGGGAGRNTASGASLLAVDTGRRVYRPQFLGLGYIGGSSGDLQSSEKLAKAVFVSNLTGMDLPGGALLDASIDIVGVVANPAKGEVIPFEYLAPAFRELLKQGKAMRPFLGVNYIDLGASPVKRPEGERGALITGLGGLRGVAKGSPAAVAGLLDGDILLKVDDDELTSKINLSERIAEYPPGAAIRLHLRHKDGREEIKEIVLGARP